MKPITTKEIMELEDWPKIKETIFLAMAKTKEEIGCKEIILVDKGDHWHIVADGVPLMEIGAESLIPTDKKE